MSTTENTTGLGCFFDAFSWLFRPKLRRFVYVPLLVNIVVYGVGMTVFAHFFEGLMARFLPEDAWWSFLRFVLWPLFTILLALTAFYTFTVIANILASPFNGWLAEQVEFLETGKKPENPLTLMQDIRQSMWSEIVKLSYFGLRALILLILTFVPVINVISPFLWFVFSAWMLSMQYMDYPLANHGIAFKDQRTRLKPHRANLLSFGAVASGMNLIPVLNFIVMPVSVITSTLYWCRRVSVNKK